MSTRLWLVLIATLIPSPLFSNTIYFPQAVAGGGYSTTFVILNTGTTDVASRVNFYDQGGAGRAAYSKPINVAAGGSTRFTLPNTGPLTILWGELAAPSGTVQGIATFDLRQANGGLIATADAAAVEAGNGFVLPVDVTSTSSTGIAIANVNDGSAAGVRLRLFGEDGTEVATGSDVRLNLLASRRQVADMVTGIFPQLSGTTFRGTLVVERAPGTPPNSLAVTALTVKEGMFAALPVIPHDRGDAGGPPLANTLYFPQVSFGDGYSTTFVIMNTGPAAISSRIDFYNGVRRNEYSRPVDVPAGGSTRFTLPDTGPSTVLWAELAAAAGAVGVAIIDRRTAGGTLLTTASIMGTRAGGTFRFPVEGTPAASTAIAVANVTDGGPMTVGLQLISEEGTVRPGDMRTIYLGPRQLLSPLVGNIFPEVLGPTFRGTLWISLPVPAIIGGTAPNSLAATAFTLKERGSPPPALTALPRDLTSAERKTLEAANTFSLALWSKTNAAQRGENVFVSPLSASFALGMTLNGAANQTFDEMRTALRMSGATEQEINEGYRSLMGLLMGLDPAVKIQIANSIWYHKDFPFLQSFLDASKQYFDAEVRGLNFADKAPSLAAINGWVDEKTNHKIPTILDAIGDHVMFLINAIYFNGAWRDKFNPEQTRQELFHAAGGSTQPVSLMRRNARMAYVESPAYQAVDLPYGNSAFTMTVVLPKQGADIESLAASLTPTAWQSLTEGLRSTDVDLAIPKLKLTYERTLNDDLKALGMTSAFDPRMADFTRMSPMGRSLVIDFVKQKTFVDINEEGTEAAAVTVAGVVPTCACPPVPVAMRVDRPYIFAIREQFSGTLLFMAKIVRMP